MKTLIKHFLLVVLTSTFLLPIGVADAARIVQPQNFLGTTMTCALGNVVGRTCVVILTTVGSGTLTIPPEWHNGKITVEVLGGGGGAGTNVGGGGGGGYARENAANISGAIGYSVGAKGVAGDNASSTWLCNSTANCSTSAGSAVIVAASGGSTDIAGSGTGAAGGVFLVGDSGNSGGSGGNRTGSGGGGGGGSAGPYGRGGGGGSGDPTGGGPQGGGGGADGGTAGVSGTSGVAGNGGDNRLGVGHGNAATSGADCTVGTNGGGGGGAFNGTHAVGCAGSTDGIWTDGIQTVGPGAGGGGASINQSGGNGGTYGGGAASNASGANNSTAGQGLIVITYSPYMTAFNHSITASSSPFSNNLLSHWSFDGSQTNWATNRTFDGSGNGNTASLVALSTSTSPVAGVVGQALTFNGVNQYANKSGAILSGVYPNWTVAVWIKTTAVSVSNNGRAIYSERAAAGNDILKLDSFATVLCPNSVFVTLRNDAGTLLQGACSSKAINDNKWHLIVMTLSGVPNTQAASIWVDGVFSNTASWTGGNTFTNANRQSRIAGDAGDNQSWTQGTLDDIRLYNRALSAGEIRQLYTLGKTNIAHSSAGPNAPVSSGLVGYWPFDGSTINWATNSFRDISAQANHATSTGMSTSTSPVAGKVGQALRFNGTGSYLTIANSSALQVSSALTVNVWTNVSSHTGAHREVFRKSNGNYGWFLDLNSTNKMALSTSGAVGEYSLGFAYPADSKWHMVTGTFDGTTIRMYMDGAFQTSYAGAALTVTSDPAAIGQYTGAGGGQLFNGSIDEVRVYNRALSPNEIKQLYDSAR